MVGMMVGADMMAMEMEMEREMKNLTIDKEGDGRVSLGGQWTRPR
jgi:hypothetical protein